MSNPNLAASRDGEQQHPMRRIPAALPLNGRFVAGDVRRRTFKEGIGFRLVTLAATRVRSSKHGKWVRGFLPLLAAFNLHLAPAQPAFTREHTNAAPPRALNGPAGSISVHDGHFVDAQGRQVLLHGLCVINKSKAENYQSWHGPADFAAMRDWGMNCIRLGILWDGLEPQPGLYDEVYLQAVDRRIAWAKAVGIHVFLDMHQDLYSYKYSDGAPEWATLTDDQPHVTGGAVWSDAYVSSPAIQRAFDNFWANNPCADGVGVQEHFARAWQHVARRYAHETTVIGFDLFNEPNIGSGNRAAQVAMVTALASALPKVPGQPAQTAEDIARLWMDRDGRSQLMQVLTNLAIYRQVVDAAGPVYMEFERTQLMPMFQRVRDAIRAVNTNQLIFLETSMSANMGIPSGVERIRNQAGSPDPLQAYAPHGYDIVVDTPDLANASHDRVEFIFQRHAEKARQLGLPLLIGEWGAFGNAGAGILPTARHTAAVFERRLCSDTYWDYSRNLQREAYFTTLQRPIPQAIAGTLLSYRGDPETRIFTCVWREDGQSRAPSVIYLPQWIYGGQESLRVEPPGTGFSIERTSQESKNHRVTIFPIGNGTERKLSVQPATR